jgi:hypothetical protein
MCIPNRNLDPKDRRRRVVANLALVVALLWWQFRASIPVSGGWFDASFGLLIGVSIGINLITMLKARRLGGCVWGGKATGI